MVRSIASLALVPALLALVAGCGGGERIRDVYFGLQATAAVTPSARPIPGTLRVSPLSARGFIGGSRIVYRTAAAPLEVQRYDAYLWEEPPARALADALLAGLRAGGVFENVVGAAAPVRADYLLTGELLRFEHRPTDTPPGVTAEMSLTLVDARSRNPMLSKTYSGFEPTPGEAGRTTPEAMVAAFNRLGARLITEAVADAQASAPRLR
jgi:cholesterol transport system auxiliary component